MCPDCYPPARLPFIWMSRWNWVGYISFQNQEILLNQSHITWPCMHEYWSFWAVFRNSSLFVWGIGFRCDPFLPIFIFSRRQIHISLPTLPVHPVWLWTGGIGAAIHPGECRSFDPFKGSSPNVSCWHKNPSRQCRQIAIWHNHCTFALCTLHFALIFLCFCFCLVHYMGH